MIGGSDGGEELCVKRWIFSFCSKQGQLNPRLLEGLMERHGSRAKPRPRRAFFSDSSSFIELDEVFQISLKLELDLSEYFSKNYLARSIDFEDYSIQTPPPPKYP